MKRIALLLVMPLAVEAQTTINGGRIFKGTLDASGAASTLPYRTGAGSPVGRDTCGKPGETYFQTDAPAGQNVWGCTAAGVPGTWNQLTAGASVVTGTSTPVVSCSAGALYVRTDIPQFYICSATNTWQLASYGSNVLANRPVNCVSGQVFLATDAGALSFCAVPGSPGTWQSLGGAIGSVFGRTGAVTAQAGDYTAAQVTNAAQTTAGNTFTAGTQDFSQAAHTLPAKVGATAAKPATCSVGEMYFATDATAGQNWYYCTAANTWTQQSSPAALVPSVFGRTGAVTAQTGDYTAAQVTNAAQINVGNAFTAGTQDFSQAAHTLPAKVGATAAKPATCSVGEMYFATDATAGQNWYYCTAANTWTQQSSPAAPVPSVFGRTGAVTAQSGDYTAAQVTNAAQINAGNTFTAGTQDFSQAAHTLPAKVGATTAKPATCSVGEMYFATDATAGQNWYYCTAANTWTQQSSPAAPVPSVFGRTGAVTAQAGDYTAAQVTNAAQTTAGNTFTAGTQDFSQAAHTLPAKVGATAAKPATCSVGEMYFATDATAGQNWYYCTAANTWTQQSSPAAPVPSVFGRTGAVTAQAGDYTAAQVTNAAQTNAGNTFTAGTQNFSQAAHTLPAKVGTAASRPATCTQGEMYFATDGTAGQNWYYCTAANTWTAQSFPAAPVPSVFGRTGAVTAQAGDYTPAQVGALADPGSNGVIKRTAADVTAAAAASDIVGLFTSCSGTQYLGADGTCHTAAAGGNASIAQTTVPYSATPTFTRSSNIQEFTMNLTGNVTASTLSGAVANDILIFQLCQDAAGGRTFTWPSGFGLAASISPTANSCTKQQFVWDGANANPSAPGTSTDTPFLISGAPERAAPATPAGGIASLWPDATRHTWTSTENNSGNQHIMARCAGTTDQCASSDLSDAANIDLLNGNQTISGNKTFTGQLTASSATHTTPTIVVATAGALPATCTTGELGFVTGATAGQQIYECSATNTWTQQSGAGGSGITQLTGDVTAGPGSGSQAATVVKIQGNAVKSGAPTTQGQYYSWNTTNSDFELTAAPGGGGGCTVLSGAGQWWVPGGSFAISNYADASTNTTKFGAGGTANWGSTLWFYAPCGWTVNTMSWYQSAACTGHESVAIYNASGTRVLYSGVLGTATSPACNATGEISITSSFTGSAGFGTAQSAGWYLLGITSDDTAATMTGMGCTSSSCSAIVGATKATGFITGTSGGAMPSTLTLSAVTANAAAVPLVVLTY